MLRIMAKAKFLRKLLPGWHTREKAFRDWYVKLVERFTYFDSPQDYEFYVEALRSYEPVRGYREIRYPLMEKAIKDAGDKISADTKKQVEDAIAKVNEVKAKDNVEEIKKEMENLGTVMQKIGEEMAKNAQAQNPGENNQQPGNEGE
jgi:hypothetical protein